MYTNITEKQALDYITDYANKNTGGDFLGAMIKLKENIATEPDIKLRVCFAVHLQVLVNFLRRLNNGWFYL